MRFSITQDRILILEALILPVSGLEAAWFHSALACFEERDLLVIAVQRDPKPEPFQNWKFRLCAMHRLGFELRVQFRAQSLARVQGN